MSSKDAIKMLCTIQETVYLGKIKFYEAIDVAIKALEQQEVIRCKDCKHMITHEGYGYLGEPAYTCEGNMEGWVLPDSFCSNAERKDGD